MAIEALWPSVLDQAFRERRQGAYQGFVLSFVFMLSGYTGSESALSRFPFFARLGLFGAMCGLILGWIGFFLKSRLAQRNRNT